MKKIKTVFRIDRDNRTITTDIVADWVVAGEGVATVKHDGTSCAVINGLLHKRYDAKNGKIPPDDFIPCEEKPDTVTGHWPGWVPVKVGNPADKLHIEAFGEGNLADGTYELVGPKVQKNPYGLAKHELFKHGCEVVEVPDRSFDALKAFLEVNNIEGLVFHHPDGRMAKIRRKDFNFIWNK